MSPWPLCYTNTCDGNPSRFRTPKVYHVLTREYVMSTLHPLNGQRLAYWLAGLMLLLIFSSFTPSYSRSGATSGFTPGLRPFIVTWTNTHLFQTSDYKISAPASLPN